MTTTEPTTVVGVFADSTLAEQALGDLRHAGFHDDDIGFIVRNIENSEIGPDALQKETAAGATTGAVGGGVIGGLLGAAAALLVPGIGPALAGGILAATLGGAALGAIAGGFVGALTGLGIADEEARFYQSEFETGRTIVTVRARGRSQEALAILQRHGAYDATGRGSAQPAPQEPSQEEAQLEETPLYDASTLMAGTYDPNAAVTGAYDPLAASGIAAPHGYTPTTAPGGANP
jgi:hypothetical protein